ncbi:hypothetical protein [Cellulosimicrobium cellulans]|uniref:Uncharacterized protein n=1 Tax=Cellulosimicrobium cellulans TaxID=1710 RepID=A0A4Y4E5G1_CELCE|nr:hypothetical protein [Cellulosimicrobium cellulans]GED11274.1 hypothetical protein CCE02nite_32730 [Cellulosimicrobium cellulans]
MSNEDEIGQELDRFVRSTLMAVGQIRERAARQQAGRSMTEQRELARVASEAREQTSLVYDRVRRPDFWDRATPAQVAEVEAYAAAVAPHDARGRETHLVIGEQLRNRYGVDLDAIHRAHPQDQDARRVALDGAVDQAQAQNVYRHATTGKFWKEGSRDELADVVTYAAARTERDEGARHSLNQAQQGLQARFGIDLTKVRSAHPDSEADRRNALLHAIDDAEAAHRQDEEAREDLREADNLEDRAEEKHGQGDPTATADEERADDAHADAREHLAEHDRLHDSAEHEAGRAANLGPQKATVPAYARTTDAELRQVPAAAAAARRESSPSFPRSANATLRESSRRNSPRALTRRSSQTRERAHELAR